MRAFTAAAIAAFLLASPSGAQDRRTVTEAEFLAGLDERHPAVATLRAEIGEAAADQIRARTLSAAELAIDREAPEAAPRQIDLTLRWQPPRPDRRRLEIAAAGAGLEAARARFAGGRLRLLESARETFARWAVGTSATEVLERQVTALEALSDRERRRAEAGEVSGLDADRVAVAVARSRSDLARASADRAAALASARAWRPDLPSGVAPELPPLPPSAAVSETTHPRLAALTSELERARVTERLLGKIAEVPTVVAGWQRQEAAGETFDGPLLGLSWPLPLLDRRRAERTAARARVEALEAELAFAEREIAAAREGSLRAYEELRAAALGAGSAALEVPSLIAAASASFTAGETDLTDLLDTLRSSTDIEIDALELRAEALAAHRQLVLSSAPLSEATPAPQAAGALAPATEFPGDPR